VRSPGRGSEAAVPADDHRLLAAFDAGPPLGPRPGDRRQLYRELVAHGRGSGDDLAVRFSNEPGSHQSSLGLFLTGEAYSGSNGYSLRLDGLEPDVNDRARERAIVMHGAPYVSTAVARAIGRLGRSWGCPAVPAGVAPDVIDIKGGSLVFVTTPTTGGSIRRASWVRAARSDRRPRRLTPDLIRPARAYTAGHNAARSEMAQPRTYRRALVLSGALISGLGLGPCRVAGAAEPASAADPDVGATVATVLGAMRHPELKWPSIPDVAPTLKELYAGEPDGLFWFDGTTPIAAVPAIVRGLALADEQGLDRADYDADRLAERWRTLVSGADVGRPARLFDLALA
jgi:hypothetical protein